MYGKGNRVRVGNDIGGKGGDLRGSERGIY